MQSQSIFTKSDLILAVLFVFACYLLIDMTPGLYRDKVNVIGVCGCICACFYLAAKKKYTNLDSAVATVLRKGVDVSMGQANLVIEDGEVVKELELDVSVRTTMLTSVKPLVLQTKVATIRAEIGRRSML